MVEQLSPHCSLFEINHPELSSLNKGRFCGEQKDKMLTSYEKIFTFKNILNLCGLVVRIKLPKPFRQEKLSM